MSLLDTQRLADARKVFVRNKIYAVEPPIEGYSELKYFDTFGFDDGAIIHAFGKAHGPDETDRRHPKVVARIDDTELTDYTFNPFYATRVSEVAIKRKLPFGIARNIESYITGETERERTAKQRRRSGGRRRKTRRVKSL
jgi:hypothetical protein